MHIRPLILLATCIFIAPGWVNAATTLSGTYSNISLHLAKEASPYVVDGEVYVDQFSSLRIAGGVVVKFKTATSSLRVHGAVPIENGATADAPIYFTSIKDDEHGGDTNGDGNAAVPVPGDWGYVSFGCGTNFVPERTPLSYVRVSYGGAGQGSGEARAMEICFGQAALAKNFTVEHLTIADNLNGLLLVVDQNPDHTVSIHNSSIYGNTNYGVKRLPNRDFRGNDVASPIDLSENWWGDASGPSHPSINPSGIGDAILPSSGYFRPITALSWLSTDPLPEPEPVGCTVNCNPNILFLPGIMASRLYASGEKLWEPGSDAEVQQLYLGPDGTSVTQGVVATEVIDEFSLTNTAADLNIYKSFLTELAAKKTDGIIADYSAHPYDWRLSIPDILADDALEQTLRDLAASSRTGKVAIVAHSNGGLIAKALINALASEAPDLIDQLILVGVPQTGTPQAVGALLHGYDSGLPFDWLDFILSSERARDFAKNAPATYQLLPHPDYYSNLGFSVSTPLITFEEGEKTKIFTDLYGASIETTAELYGFLRGEEERDTPSYADLVAPAIANAPLLQNATDYASTIGSTWQAPVGITVHQIAGVGELTLAGIEYETINHCDSALSILSVWYCATNTKTLAYSPVRVIDGDKTVIEPSALAMPESDEVKRWWVDLQEYNDQVAINRDHKNLLEVPDVQTLIFNNVFGISTTTYTYISNTKPVLTGLNRLSFTLHSPLALSYTENDGTLVNEQNPDGKYSEYTRYGEVQIIDIFGEEGEGRIVMTGETMGSFTLEIEEAQGNTITGQTTYSGIPSSTSTEATIEVSGSTVEETGNLLVDYDGDDAVDFTLSPSEGEEVSLSPAPAIEPTVVELIDQLLTYIDTNVTNKQIKRALTQQLGSIKKAYKRQEALKEKFPQLAALSSHNPALKLLVKVLDKQVDVYTRFGRLDEAVAAEIKKLLGLIEEKL